MALFLKYISTGLFCAFIASRLSSTVFRVLFYYAFAVLVAFGMLFYLRQGEGLLGKSRVTGCIPEWSYVAFWPFHLVNNFQILLTNKVLRRHIPVAQEILPNWWIGGVSSNEAPIKQWEVIVDLTNEFPERSKATGLYLNLPIWDGNAPTVAELEQGAIVMATGALKGPSLCHCAFGVGRSTTLMTASLIFAGKAKTIEEAFQIIKAKRSIVKLNSRMRASLEMWMEWRSKEQ